MKYLILGLLLVSVNTFAQTTFRCLSKEDMQSPDCKLSYDLLSRVAVAKQRGEIPGDVSLREMEANLRSGKLSLPEKFSNLSVTEKRRSLYRGMNKDIKDGPVFESPSSMGSKESLTFKSGTRGGGLELPEDLWIWF